MKNQITIKNGIRIGVALTVATIGLAASAQTTFLATRYDPKTLTAPASIAASATNSSEVVLDVRNVDSLLFQLSARLMATNPAAATLILPLFRSLDNVTYESAAFASIALTFTGTVQITAVTNTSFGDAGYVKIGSWINSATNIVTTNSISLVAVPKPDRTLNQPFRE